MCANPWPVATRRAGSLRTPRRRRGPGRLDHRRRVRVEQFPGGPVADVGVMMLNPLRAVSDLYGARVAVSLSSCSAARAIRNNSGVGVSARPNAAPSASRCRAGSSSRCARTGRSSWCRPAKGRLASDCTPEALSTSMPLRAAWPLASVSSVDFPIPGSPRTTTAPPRRRTPHSCHARPPHLALPADWLADRPAAPPGPDKRMSARSRRVATAPRFSADRRGRERRCATPSANAGNERWARGPPLVLKELWRHPNRRGLAYAGGAMGWASVNVQRLSLPSASSIPLCRNPPFSLISRSTC
jgi:hypothetical protein